jgi:Zn-dependent M28 family amino/carboxypeptidase
LLESGTRWTVEKFQKQDGQSLPSIIASEKLATAILEGEKRDAATIIKGEAGEAFELSPSKQIKFSINVKSEQTNTQNVVAVLEGSDPKLKNEYVAIGAHYDHVGMGTPINGDGIWNGADDDGSGTVSVLSIAEAFAAGPRPKRSLLFVWHCGEEKGLWGSRYVTDYPVIPLNEIVAQLNIDMIGRSKHEGDTLPVNKDLTGPHEIYVIGSKMMSTDLGAVSEQVNNSFLKLTFNYKYDDPKDPQRFFFRSDHYNYARKGIPIIFYFDGTHEDYHKPTDHPDKIDYQKMERVARTVLATAWELANRPERPKVDKQLPQELMGN